MSCDKVRHLISPLLDRKLAAEQKEYVLQHLAVCRACSTRAETMDSVRASLRSMRAVPVPARLSAQLQISASKERVRQASRRTLSSWLSVWAGSFRLAIDNMMRPLALPFAGGVFSAFLIFSVLMPTLAFQRTIGGDVPIALFTDPALEEMGHPHITADETILEVTVDERGRVTDYSTPQGKLSPEMVNDLLFYRFAPATAFGQPTWGKVTITFRRSTGGSHIVVRG